MADNALCFNTRLISKAMCYIFMPTMFQKCFDEKKTHKFTNYEVEYHPRRKHFYVNYLLFNISHN